MSRQLSTIGLLLLGCNGDAPSAGKDSGAGNVDPPCADGGWGAISDPDAAVHVSAGGSDDGDGSAAAPVATLDAGLALSRAEGRPIAVWPGGYEANLSLQVAPSSGGTDVGLDLAGCGAGEVVVAPADAGLPILLVTEATGVRVAGLTLSGGRRALVAWSGAEVEIEGVRVEDAEVLGIAIDGSDTFASLVDTEVYTVSEDAGGGYGIQLTGGELTMSGGGVWEATGAGILIDFATFTLNGVTVEATAPSSEGSFGRGVQVQSQSSGAITGGSLAGNADTALFVSEAWTIAVEGVEVSDTSAGVDPESGDPTGDGIVVTQGEGNLDPALFTATLTDNLVTGSARAGIVLAGVTGSLDGNTTTGNGASADDGSSIFAQGGASTSGADAATALGEDEAFVLNQQELALDGLSD